MGDGRVWQQTAEHARACAWLPCAKQVEYLECWKVVDTAGNTSGDLCGVPGLLHAIGLFS